MADSEVMLVQFNKFVRDKQLLEALITQCDVFITELFDEISFFSSTETSEVALSRHTKAANLLLYYKKKRIELTESLFVLVAPYHPPSQVG
ncbi:hypothetical protein GCM10027592_57080 [Spirosoma flavus]